MTSVNGTQWKYTIGNSGEGTWCWDKACPIITAIKKVHSLKEASKATLGAPYPAAQACSEQSAGRRGTPQVLFSSLLESHRLCFSES